MAAESKSHWQAVQVSDRVWWVGAVDWGLRDFHGYATLRGTTYNAYLVLADRAALIDTVKAPFWEEMRARIASVVDPAKVEVVVCNHAEMDHSGALPQVIAACQPEEVIASVPGQKALRAHFQLDREVRGVKEGETVDLGGATLAFAEMRMLHWPESMATFLAEEAVLFSNDAFGMHLASSGRFDDEIPESVLLEEASTYYANILLPFSGLITRALEKVRALGELRLIAPSHGPIWRRDWRRILDLYGGWAAQRRRNKAVVIYDTMWQSTAEMARAVVEGLIATGVEVKLLPLKAAHRSQVMAELLDAAALVVGSPTLNNGILPTVADVLTYAKGLKPKGLIGAAFGSHGWSGEGVPQLEAMLQELKVELAAEGVKAVYVPDEAVLQQCYDLGQAVGEKAKARSSA